MTTPNLTAILALSLCMTFMTACARYDRPATSTTDKSTGLDVVATPGIAVTPATGTQCPAGGLIYAVYLDENGNGGLDTGETITSTQIVCNGVNGVNGANGANGTNGQNGADGFSTLFSLNRVSTGFSACASGAGIQVNSGLDLDRSSTLEPSEITQAQILCDGEAGADGAAGPAGSSGHNMVFQTATATSAQCAAGGTTLVMALDTEDTGHYSATLPQQQSITLCNGVNGTNGANGTNATVATYTPVEAIQPCGSGPAYREVLLRLYSGQVLASFSNDTTGTMTRLAFIPDGTYTTTDGTSCQFSLATTGQVGHQTRSISWFGLIQKTWSLTLE